MITTLKYTIRQKKKKTRLSNLNHRSLTVEPRACFSLDILQKKIDDIKINLISCMNWNKSINQIIEHTRRFPASRCSCFREPGNAWADAIYPSRSWYPQIPIQLNYLSTNQSQSHKKESRSRNKKRRKYCNSKGIMVS
jgi:hypothetical protein